MWLQVFIITIILAAGVRLWNGWQSEAKQRGVAQAEKQIADGLLRNERDAAESLKKALGERDARIAALTAKQKAKATNEKIQRKANPAYGTWANTPVPQLVADELRSAAGTPSSVRAGAGDEQPSLVVQTSGASTAADNGQRPAQALRLGPARAN